MVCYTTKMSITFRQAEVYFRYQVDKPTGIPNTRLMISIPQNWRYLENTCPRKFYVFFGSYKFLDKNIPKDLAIEPEELVDNSLFVFASKKVGTIYVHSRLEENDALAIDNGLKYLTDKYKVEHGEINQMPYGFFMRQDSHHSYMKFRSWVKTYSKQFQYWNTMLRDKLFDPDQLTLLNQEPYFYTPEISYKNFIQGLGEGSLSYQTRK